MSVYLRLSIAEHIKIRTVNDKEAGNDNKSQNEGSNTVLSLTARSLARAMALNSRFSGDLQD